MLLEPSQVIGSGEGGQLVPVRVICNPETRLQKKELPACNRHPAHALRDQSRSRFTVTTALETSMRKLFILTALIFAFLPAQLQPL